MAGGEPPESAMHLLSFLALIRLAHSAAGQQALAAHLPRVAAAVLHGLNLDSPVLRRNCVMVCRDVCYHGELQPPRAQDLSDLVLAVPSAPHTSAKPPCLQTA